MRPSHRYTMIVAYWQETLDHIRPKKAGRTYTNRAQALFEAELLNAVSNDKGSLADQP